MPTEGVFRLGSGAVGSTALLVYFLRCYSFADLLAALSCAPVPVSKLENERMLVSLCLVAMALTNEQTDAFPQVAERDQPVNPSTSS